MSQNYLYLPKITLFIHKYKYYLFAIYFFLLSFGELYAIYCFLILFLSLFYFSEFKNNLTNNLYVYLFALIWVPMALSLTDAVYFERSFVKTLTVVPFLFVGLYLSEGLTKDKLYKVMQAITIIAFIWCIDFSLYHFRLNQSESSMLWEGSFPLGGRFKGDGYIYYIPILGQVLSVLMPILLETLRRYSSGKKDICVSFCITAIFLGTIFLSGNRNAVIMSFFSVVSWMIFVNAKIFHFKINKKVLVTAFIVLSVLFAGLSTLKTNRFIESISFDSMNLKTLDKLSSSRIALWETAINISKENWLNGIGPRGFRYEFDKHRPEVGKYAVEYEFGSTHPHFALLEIFTETGAIGLLSIFILFILMIKKALLLDSDNQVLVVPWIIAVFTTILPNIGKAFYSSYWLTFIIFLIIGCSSVLNLNQKKNQAKY